MLLAGAVTISVNSRYRTLPDLGTRPSLISVPDPPWSGTRPSLVSVSDLP